MTIENFNIAPIFAEPIYRADISDSITDKHVEYIQNLEMNRNQSNLISKNLYIFEEPELIEIKNVVQEALDFYAAEVMGINQQLYVTQSWSLINNPGVGMHTHSHSNSVVSGSLYYCEMPVPIAGMIFDRHRTYQQIDLTPSSEKRSIYNTSMNLIAPKKGEVILFSSSLQHNVEPNTSSQDRYSIAFNAFIKGKLGNFRDVSELILE